ncbi:MAG: hypothetical protein QOJ68_1801, partial [Blastococcus sp.]|nr:hypothetical protein [Blastococcus sp.]
MYDYRSPAAEGRKSVFEELVRSALVELTGRRVWIVDHEPHGRGRAVAPDCDGPEI